MKPLILYFFILFSTLSCFSQYIDSSELLLEMRRDYSFIEFADIDQDGDDDILAGVANLIYMHENDGSGNFLPRTFLLEVDNYLRFFKVIDVNSDGLLDIITTHSSYAESYYRVQIWGKVVGLDFNLESSFQASTNGGDRDNSFAYEDIDNDGLKDIITTGNINSNIFKHISGFDFTFSESVSVAYSIAVGDVNNDGWLDIVGGIYENFRVALNDGTGSFPTMSNVYGPSSTNSTNDSEIELIDYDTDGDLDVVHLINGDFKIFIHSNDGNGIFTLSQTIVNVYDNIFDLTKHDLNSDGILDIAYKYSTNSPIYEDGTIKCLLGNGTSFGAVQNLNESYTGIPPLKFSSNLGNGVDNLLLYGSLNPVIKHFTLAKKTAPAIYDDELYISNRYYKGHSNMLVEDFNDDSLVDFAKPPLFYFNQGNSIFTPYFDSTLLGYNAQIVEHGDLNNDGIEDLIGIKDIPNYEQLVYFYGLPGGGFGVTNGIVSDFIDEVSLHDINNDGWLDIYYTNIVSSYPEIHHVINQSGTSFNEYEYLSFWNYNNLSSSNFVDYLFAKNDTVWDNIEYAYLINDQLSVALNDGSTPQELGINADRINLKDINGDGYCDIFYIRYTNGIGWVKNEGNNVFTDMGIIYPLNYCVNPVFKDLDNDMDIDIIVQEQDSTTLYLLEAVGYGEYASPVPLVSDAKKFLATGFTYNYATDLENDGDMDIIYMKPSPASSSQLDGDMYKIESFLAGSNAVSGFIFNDENQNELWETNESNLPSIPVSLNESIIDYSAQNGQFFFSPPDDNYILEPSIPQNWSLTTDSSSFNVSVSSQNPTVDSLFFGLSPDTTIYDSEAELTGGFPRCNSEVNFWLSIHNTGTTLSSGVLELILDDSLTYLNALTAPDSIIGNSYFWSYDSLDLFSYTGINTSILMPDFQSMGDTLSSFLINHIKDSTGAFINAKMDTLEQVVVCGYDPNDKTVVPSGFTQSGFIQSSESTLEYLIRFQNTGTDTAFNIRITDQIHANLDISTVEVLGYSHNLTSQSSSNNQLVFEFDSILLPDSSENFMGSQGYIKFRIDLKQGLNPGDEIFNRANIYFDANPPVLTNTTLNTIYSCDNLIDSITNLSGSLCIDDTISISANSFFNNNIEWYLNDSLVSSSNTINFLGTGNSDTLKLIKSTPYCSQDSTWIIQIDPSVTPDLMINDTVNTCYGENVLLESNYSTGNSWYYNNSVIDTSSTLEASYSGEFVLMVNQGTCSNTDTVYLEFHQTPYVIIWLDNVEICEGESYQVNSNHLNGNTWYFEGNQVSNNNSILVDQDGVYTLHTTNPYCSSYGEDSIDVIVHPLPTPEINVINDETMVSVDTYENYSWLDCNNSMYFVPGEYSQSFTPATAGEYALRVTDQFDCSDTSDCLEIGFLDINKYNNPIKILPNPASETLFIQGLIKPLKVSLANTMGQEVLKVRTSGEIDVSSINNGTYFVSFSLSNKLIIKKVIIMK